MIGNYIADPASGQSAYAKDGRVLSYSQGMQITDQDEIQM